ncbi:MAG: MFS transporter, partial [Oceanospirillaceae bacterium]|nr:MFS transporter [Oceanospirillaceae bacterium]
MSAAARPVFLLTLCYIAFIFLGLPDALLSIAWPTMSREFNWTIESLGTLMVGGTIGYMSTSFMAGSAMARLGIAGLLIGSSILTAISL